MKETKFTERFALQFGVQAFNVFNHVQLGDPGSLTLNYMPGGDTPASAGANLSAPSLFAVITNTVNGLGTNTGTGLPCQLQFYAARQVLAGPTDTPSATCGGVMVRPVLEVAAS
jgi:hypothetical protein